MKLKATIFFLISVVIYFLFCFHKYDFKIEDKYGSNKYFYLDRKTSILCQKNIKINGFISSDSVFIKLNIFSEGLHKFENEEVIVLYKGDIDTAIGISDYYDKKYQIEYISFPRNKTCNNKLEIKIRIL